MPEPTWFILGMVPFGILAGLVLLPVFLIILLVLASRRSGRRRENEKEQEAIVQELHTSMKRMGKRIENLETILMHKRDGE